ncbi:hypothetical protein QYE76_050736 [Lolium multiflorum]|uniref:Uncharacterized protein n=1 Tax=Lolium multiflorum TaxID=4521 RepID=A0AAD8SQL3_LOLMU|nr:hypothetical protein QYE76_050736 [Lolium multiflorum]
MVAGNSRNGRGGGQIGHGGSSTERGGSSTGEREKTEAEKLRFDAACIRGSYRYRNYGLAAPPSFAKRESEQYRRGCASSPSAASLSSGSSSRQRPSTALVVKMEVDAEPEPPRLPQFAPGYYLDDEQLKLVLPQLDVNAGLAPGDFVEERDLDMVSSRARASRTRTRPPNGGTSSSSGGACSSTSSAMRSEESAPTRRRHVTGLVHAQELERLAQALDAGEPEAVRWCSRCRAVVDRRPPEPVAGAVLEAGVVARRGTGDKGWLDILSKQRW